MTLRQDKNEWLEPGTSLSQFLNCATHALKSQSDLTELGKLNDSEYYTENLRREESIQGDRHKFKDKMR
jgi:hypothetical protein